MPRNIFYKKTLSRMDKNQEKVIFTGLEVVKNYYSGDEPFITHGLFRIQNNTNISFPLEIHRIRCLAGDKIIEIPNYFLYLLPDYQEIKQDVLKLPVNKSIELEISFQRISAIPYLYEKVCIELQILFENKLKSIKSPYTIQIRTKSKEQLTK